MAVKYESRECIVFRERNNYAVCYRGHPPITPGISQADASEDVTLFFADKTGTAFERADRRLGRPTLWTIENLQAISDGLAEGKEHKGQAWRRIEIEDIEHPRLKHLLMRERLIREDTEDRYNEPEDKPQVTEQIMRGARLIAAHMDEAFAWTDMALIAVEFEQGNNKAIAAGFESAKWTPPLRYRAQDYSRLFSLCDDKADFKTLQQTSQYLAGLRSNAQGQYFSKAIRRGAHLMRWYLDDLLDDREFDTVVSYEKLHDEGIGIATRDDLHDAARWIIQSLKWAEKKASERRQAKQRNVA